jgi:energy-coupling factor transporter ATP-binding protein EcfA2
MATRCLADVRAEPVRWLWPGRVATGKVTLIAGNPGLGKSQITAAMASIVTSGGLWPSDGTRAERGAVAFLSAEDDAADTLVPRLKAAGADLARCHVLDAVLATNRDGLTVQRGCELSRDVGTLADTLLRLGDVRLLVIDPISAYLGTVDSHRNAEVRAVLASLADMAARLAVAVVAVSHLNKAGGADALSRVTGSLAFVAAARAAWIVAQDPHAARRLLVPLKNNLGPDGSGLSFDIEPVTVDDGIDTSRVVWHADPVTMTADEALAAGAGSNRRGDAPQRRQAQAWLAEALSAGPASSDELLKAASKVGISRRTLFRAKDALGVVATKGNFKGGWAWRLPADGCHSDTGRVPTKEILAPLADSEPGRGSTQIFAKNAKLSEGGTLGEGCTADEYRAARGMDP